MEKKEKRSVLGVNKLEKVVHILKYCRKLTKDEIEYCYQCNDFPCKQLQKIDDKYRERFDMSMIENLEYIKKNGMEKFLQKQEDKYKCPKCGGVVCVHNSNCYSCTTPNEK